MERILHVNIHEFLTIIFTNATLKDFLKVFNYDNFGQRACETIKAEFKTRLAAQLSKQRTIESQQQGGGFQK